MVKKKKCAGITIESPSGLVTLVIEPHKKKEIPVLIEEMTVLTGILGAAINDYSTKGLASSGEDGSRGSMESGDSLPDSGSSDRVGEDGAGLSTD